EPVFFPPAPDEPRIQFLKSFSKSTDFTGAQSAITSFIIGDEEALPILKPYGLAVGKNKIYVCDTQLNGLEIMDTKDGSFGYFLPEGRGRLKQPINCFVDSDGFLYVADAQRRQVIIFNTELDYIGEIGDSSTLLKPTDVFVAEDQIFINDISKHSIHVYDRISRKYIKSIPPASDDNKLFSPTNIAVYKDKIYVSDLGDSKVKVYDLEGKYIRTIGTIGNSPGKFSRPKGIALDEDENLYVVDAGFENVQIFNKDGKLLMYFGGSYKKPGDMWLPAKVVIDYMNLDYFKDDVDPSFNLKYLIFVTNQYGPDKISVYGFISRKNN
ncbi:6-bladed beta-propeller, partial [Ignavibacterium sp.]|uniref:6-bladed beta-propeller n=2 Tax=Ignavibacterium TaxID=795750 RepID=UPI0025BC2F91